VLYFERLKESLQAGLTTDDFRMSFPDGGVKHQDF
jgi:hypothetical protein